jgi:hypothetical protein
LNYRLCILVFVVPVSVFNLNSCDTLVGGSSQSAINNVLKNNDTLSRSLGKSVASIKDSLLNEKTKTYTYELVDSSSKIITKNLLNFVDSTNKRIIALPDSLSTDKKLREFSLIREQFTGKDLLNDVLLLRDSLLGDGTRTQVNSIVDSIYKKNVSSSITEQRVNLRGDIERVIIIAGLVIFGLILTIGFIYFYFLKTKKSLQLITDEIDDIEDNTIKTNIKNSISYNSQLLNIGKQIDNAIEIRIKPRINKEYNKKD